MTLVTLGAFSSPAPATAAVHTAQHINRSPATMPTIKILDRNHLLVVGHGHYPVSLQFGNNERHAVHTVKPHQRYTFPTLGLTHFGYGILYFSPSDTFTLRKSTVNMISKHYPVLVTNASTPG